MGGYGVLVYADSEHASHRDSHASTISLKHCFVEPRPDLDDLTATGGPAYCFELKLSHSPSPDQRDYLWWAGSEESRKDWIQFITKAALHSNIDNGYLIQRESLTAKLGTGAFSHVWKGKERGSGREWALKEIVKSDLSFDEEMSLREEIRILRIVGEHPNVVYLHEFIETEVHYYVVMEYLCGGALLDRIMQKENEGEGHRHFSEEDACDIMKQLMKAIDFLHSLNVVHRDLKPENFLLAGATTDPTRQFQHRVVLADFGCATQLEKPEALLHDITGSPGYVAPEVLMGKDGPGYGVASDVWSMGVILYILLTGICPFAHDEPELSFARTLKGDFDWNLLAGVSVTARDLIANMLRLQASRRLTAQQVLCHPWMNGEGVGTLDLRITDNVRKMRSSVRAKGHRAKDVAFKAYGGMHLLVSTSISSAAGFLGMRRTASPDPLNESFGSTGSGGGAASSPKKS